MARATLVLFSLLALYVQQGMSLHCYVCSSDRESTCSDPFTKRAHSFVLTDCDRSKAPSSYSGKIPFCRKFKSYGGSNDDNLVTVRSCTWVNEGESPCSQHLLGPHIRVESCSYCDEDSCNSASTIFSTLLIFPVTLLVSKYL
ncbi:uncharacterized protein LOC106660951 isoform X2 [Cimex lectularius]|uniref:Protein sleepless n=1 Tax=Cimex lectularius TaxID=79782 RepID=A0A8I6RAI2_CIMLE|nr:uncharacterized protein LOC106660951 isoform X2 [Cimex lectularius]